MRIFLRKTIPLLVILVLAGCNLPTSKTLTPQESAGTKAAQTLEAMPGSAEATATVSAEPAPDATPTPAEPASPAPTSDSQTASATPLSQACDLADFAGDVTIPDGSTVAPGSQFVKTWRLKNTGVCTWTTNYAVVFIDGTSFGAPAATNFTKSVPPGELIEISVNLTAPTTPGEYRGNFKLRNPSGTIFGTGSNRTAPFYVDVDVAVAQSTAGGYSFAENYCAAEWSSGAGSIPCRSTENKGDGIVTRTNAPSLETGQIDDEAGLITIPQSVENGYIQGRYPVLTVQSGDVFSTIVGCEYQASQCNVRFSLDYQADNGPVQTLASWAESYDGNYTIVRQDLSSLAGKNVQFILKVSANGSATGDRALWLLPRITR